MLVISGNSSSQSWTAACCLERQKTQSVPVLIKYHFVLAGTLQINITEEFKIQCVEIFADHGDSEILLAWLGESIHEGNYEILLPSKAKNIGPHPTLIAVNVDLYKILLKPMESSRRFCSSAVLSNRIWFYSQL